MKKAWRKIIAAVNSVINIVVMVFLILLFIIGCYVLWETKLVHTKANKATWEAYKPSVENKMSYEELIALNSDVIGWVSIYGTGIDYPVLYNEDSNFYTFRDPLKRSSMIGSIFLDSKCSPDFSDFKNILYGHHMEQHCMFGDVGNFLYEEYFNEHLYGNLFFNDKDHGLRIIGVISTGVYDAETYKTNINGLENQQNQIVYLKDKSKRWRDESFDFNSNQIVLLSTCASSSVSDRTVVVAYMGDETYENPFHEQGIWPGVEDLEGWLGFPWAGWFVALIVIVMIVAYILWQADKKKKEKKKVVDIPEVNKYGTY